MTLSFFIECIDCREKYRIRYGLGNNYPQLASFQCYECSNQIETGYDKLYGERILRGAKAIEDKNLWEENIKVVNLHPEIPTKKEHQNDPTHFQTFDVFANLEKTKADFFEFRAEQILWSTFNEKWDNLKKPLRIISSKNEDKLKTICGINFQQFNYLFNEWMSIFISGKKEDDFDNIYDEYNSIELGKIKNYVKTETKFFPQINEFCNTYMRYSQQFQSTIFHQKYGWEITNELIPNVNWNEINTVYGDLYEIVGDMYVIPTMINNVKEGREFDEFISVGFNLEKYLQTDKANRAINFESNDKLSWLSKSYHSWLRNGTHHKNSFLNNETYEISLGTSKGGTVEKKITLIEYINNCNELFGVGLILSSLIIEMKK